MRTPTNTIVSTNPANPMAPRANAPANTRQELATKNPNSAQLRFRNGSPAITQARRLACSTRSSGI